MTNNYRDIINRPRHKSKSRRPMALENRAAQFAPFAALSGFEEEILETARLTDSEPKLADHKKDEINRKLVYIRENIGQEPRVDLEYFVKDPKKEGGQIISLNSKVIGIDPQETYLELENGQRIKIRSITSLDLENEPLFY